MDDFNPRLTRRHLIEAGAVTAITVVLSGCGNVLKSFTSGPPKPTLPTNLPGANNAVGAPPQTPSAAGQIMVTDTADFYTVAIRDTSPKVPADWSLSIGGNVSAPATLSLDDLRKLPVVTEMRTFECISNPVGGPLISNAIWKGFKFSDLLNQVGARPDSLEVKLESFDGFYTGIPLDLAYDEHALLAYEMNGQPLPVEHGAPLRCLWPGRYGMKQPKWLRKITLLQEHFVGYWESQGWSNEARVKVNSRIDLPKDLAMVKEGDEITVKGVAFSGREGLAKVEISFDGKTWQPTSLVQAPEPVRPFVWTNWQWNGKVPGSGQVEITARATDNRGTTQGKGGLTLLGDTFPDGTSNMHSITLNVSKGT